MYCTTMGNAIVMPKKKTKTEDIAGDNSRKFIKPGPNIGNKGILKTRPAEFLARPPAKQRPVGRLDTWDERGEPDAPDHRGHIHSRKRPGIQEKFLTKK